MIDPRDERVDVRLRRAAESGAFPKELLICGPAGTGKTWSLLSFLHCVLADYPGVRALFLRQTRVSLSESVLVTYEEEVLPRDGMEDLADGASRAHRGSYRYPNGSRLVLGGLDRPGRVLSTAWDIVYINEATEVGEEALETLASRLDRPGRKPWLGWLVCDTNPADPAHHLKARCDDGRMALWDTTHRANPALWDGRDWTAAGFAYNARLDRLRGSRRKRLKDGLWAAAEGVWFESFGEEHVSERSLYDPLLPVWLAVDSGVFTGAVAFQVRPDPLSGSVIVTVFWDYLSEGVAARANATAILAGLAGRTGARLRAVTDPAGGSRNPIGPSVLSEYAAGGLPLDPWAAGPVADGLALVEALVNPQGAHPRLLIHPTCQRLLTALANYRRAKRGGQWTDAPEDPQHPHEDLVDALRGGLKAALPDGLSPPVPHRRRSLGQLRY